MSIFYRVCNLEAEKGLWYDPNGEFSGFIHERENIRTGQIRMDFDEELVGWLSAVPNLDDLWRWFSREEVIELQTHGFFIHKSISFEEE